MTGAIRWPWVRAKPFVRVRDPLEQKDITLEGHEGARAIRRGVWTAETVEAAAIAFEQERMVWAFRHAKTLEDLERARAESNGFRQGLMALIDVKEE